MVPIEYKHNSLVNRNLPVKLLAHRRPHDVSLVELRVNASENELSPVVVGGLAAKTQGYSSRDW